MMGYSYQQVNPVCRCSGAKDSQGLFVADTDEIHGNLFAQHFGEDLAWFPGGDDAMYLSARIGMTHKFPHSLQLKGHGRAACTACGTDRE